jgi:hypothetical protein
VAPWIGTVIEPITQAASTPGRIGLLATTALVAALGLATSEGHANPSCRVEDGRGTEVASCSFDEGVDGGWKPQFESEPGDTEFVKIEISDGDTSLDGAAFLDLSDAPRVFTTSHYGIGDLDIQSDGSNSGLLVYHAQYNDRKTNLEDGLNTNITITGDMAGDVSVYNYAYGRVTLNTQRVNGHLSVTSYTSNCNNDNECVYSYGFYADRGFEMPYLGNSIMSVDDRNDFRAKQPGAEQGITVSAGPVVGDDAKVTVYNYGTGDAYVSLSGDFRSTGRTGEIYVKNYFFSGDADVYVGGDVIVEHDGGTAFGGILVVNYGTGSSTITVTGDALGTGSQVSPDDNLTLPALIGVDHYAPGNVDIYVGGRIGGATEGAPLSFDTGISVRNHSRSEGGNSSETTISAGGRIEARTGVDVRIGSQTAFTNGMPQAYGGDGLVDITGFSGRRAVRATNYGSGRLDVRLRNDGVSGSPNVFDVDAEAAAVVMTGTRFGVTIEENARVRSGGDEHLSGDDLFFDNGIEGPDPNNPPPEPMTHLLDATISIVNISDEGDSEEETDFEVIVENHGAVLAREIDGSDIESSALGISLTGDAQVSNSGDLLGDFGVRFQIVENLAEKRVSIDIDNSGYIEGWTGRSAEGSGPTYNSAIRIDISEDSLAADVVIENTGDIIGDYAGIFSYAYGEITVSNSGRIHSRGNFYGYGYAHRAEYAENVFYNHDTGEVRGNISFGDLNDKLENSGSIVGAIALEGGDDRFVLIEGGTFDGALDMGSGLDVFEVRATSVDDAGAFSFASDLGADMEFDLGLLGIDIVEKTGAGRYTLTEEAGETSLVQRVDVLGGRLVFGSDVEVSSQATGEGSEGLGRVAIGDAVAGIETALEVQQGFRAEALSLGSGSGFYNFATGADSRVVLLDATGAEAQDATITGGAGTQRIFNRSVLDEAGLVLHEARIVNAISLGAGNDRVTNNFGVFEQAIDLGVDCH